MLHGGLEICLKAGSEQVVNIKTCFYAWASVCRTADASPLSRFLRFCILQLLSLYEVEVLFFCIAVALRLCFAILVPAMY